MKLQFKVQQYQTEAVDAVVDVFTGQPYADGVKYRIDPGKEAAQTLLEDAGLRNAEIALTPPQLLTNVHRVQQARGLEPSKDLKDPVKKSAAPINLDIEMETGTGKTYVYIKTIMELHKRYGWSKYIVVVPSIAIREGVKKSFDITAEHFQQMYGTKPRTFVYNSSRLHELERFSSDSGVQVMIINIQAFNATGKDARRIYEVLDDFQSRKPIDVIAANRPILIIDEPQKIEGDAKKPSKSLEALGLFNALFALRYSATHKIERTKVHRLDAVDAYNQKLVKKIAVRGITVKHLAGSTAYLYVDGLEVGKGADFPKARVELEVQTAQGIKRQVKRLSQGMNLHDISGGIEAYKGLFIRDVDANRDIIELSNGDIIGAGEVTQDVAEDQKRRIQIREVIRAHLDKERELFAQGIKTLSLFFIDEVAKYRDYDREDTLGEYARVFEEEYEAVLADYLGQLDLDEAAERYRKHVEAIPVRSTHEGYFSIDKKTGRSIDGKIAARGDFAGQSDDVDAYDLILKDKERLLSFEEPVRFIWSHSALREGWDNPNVFVMGMLKKSDNTTTRRQEIGRGLRLSVDQHGERMDNPVTVHDINELTVVTDESYTDFVTALQKEIIESLSARPRKASVDYFTGKQIKLADGSTSVLEKALAQALYNHLIRHDYIDDDGFVTQAYKDARADGTLAAPTAEALKPIIDFVWPLVDALYLDVPKPTDGRKPKKIPFNEANFKKREFQELWGRINHKAVYQVEFDSAELITQLHPRARQVPQRHRHAVPRRERQAGRRPRSRAARGRHRLQGLGDEGRALGRLGGLDGQVRPARRDRGEDPAHPPHLRGDPHRHQPGHVREVQAEPRAVHHRGRPAHQRAEGDRHRRAPQLRPARQPVRLLDLHREPDRPGPVEGGRQAEEERLRVRRHRLQGRAVVRREARRQRRGRRLLQAAARVLHPDTGRRLQPRLGHRLPRRRHEDQARLLRRRDQGLHVDPPAQGRRERQDRVRPQVLRLASTTSPSTTA